MSSYTHNLSLSYVLSLIAQEHNHSETDEEHVLRNRQITNVRALIFARRHDTEARFSTAGWLLRTTAPISFHQRATNVVLLRNVVRYLDL